MATLVVAPRDARASWANLVLQLSRAVAGARSADRCHRPLVVVTAAAHLVVAAGDRPIGVDVTRALSRVATVVMEVNETMLDSVQGLIETERAAVYMLLHRYFGADKAFLLRSDLIDELNRITTIKGVNLLLQETTVEL